MNNECIREIVYVSDYLSQTAFGTTHPYINRHFGPKRSPHSSSSEEQRRPQDASKSQISSAPHFVLVAQAVAAPNADRRLSWIVAEALPPVARPVSLAEPRPGLAQAEQSASQPGPQR